MFFYSIVELEENKKKNREWRIILNSKGLWEIGLESEKEKGRWEREIESEKERWESKCLERENIRSRNIGYWIDKPGALLG